MNMIRFNTASSLQPELSESMARNILEGATCTAPVNGLTHNFYRYPARFSPQFARAMIKAYTNPGDLVFDPFMGGGTSLVEARALGRNAIGTDISSLASFISEVKTTILEQSDISSIRMWANQLPAVLNIQNLSNRPTDWMELGYQRNLDNLKTWRIRKLIELTIEKISDLGDSRHQQFARCVLLKTSQWALDGKKKSTSASEFRNRLMKNLDDMASWADDYREHVYSSEKLHQLKTSINSFNQSAIDIESNPQIRTANSPKLVVTSPPYPGVHVLYHRWQVDGRRETPAPFWIANKLDGAGSSYYTMGDRKEKNQNTYFRNIEESFSSISRLLDSQSTVVQMIAFSEVSWQLPRYLRTMETAGFKEITYSQLATADDGRLWRRVPNRKWHADQKGETPGSKEVVLFHRLDRLDGKKVSIKQPDQRRPQQNHRQFQ